LFKSVPDARKRLRKTSSFRWNIEVDFVQSLCRSKIEFGETPVTKDAQRGHVLANVGKPLSTVFAKAKGDVWVNHHSIAGTSCAYASADVGNRRYVLVPKNASGSCRMARRIGEDVDIGATDADAINPQQDIVCRRDLWPREILQSPVARSMKNYRLHCFAHRLRLR